MKGGKIKQTEHWPSALPPPSLLLSFLLPSSHHILVTLWLSKRKTSEVMYSSPPSIKKVVNPKENPFIVRVQTR